MNLETANEIFAVRFYRWALEDLYREIREGLPLIASIKGSTAMRFIEIWDALSPEERCLLAPALVKWQHPRAIEITGEYLTASEQELLEAYRKSSLEACRLEEDIGRLRVAGQLPAKKVNGRNFTRAVKRELAQAFGEYLKFSYPTYTVYNPTVGAWTVNTWVETGQPASYHHSVEAADHVYLLERTSFLGWLGIRGHLVWDLVRDDDDAAAAAISIGVLCSHFMHAVPSLLEGLSHDVQKVARENPARSPAVRLVKKKQDFT